MNKDNKINLVDLSLLIKQQKECPYDKYNVTNISSWTPIPMVSKELLEKEEVTTLFSGGCFGISKLSPPYRK